MQIEYLMIQAVAFRVFKILKNIIAILKYLIFNIVTLNLHMQHNWICGLQSLRLKLFTLFYQELHLSRLDKKYLAFYDRFFNLFAFILAWDFLSYDRAYKQQTDIPTVYIYIY